jgi:hypothetical protein
MFGQARLAALDRRPAPVQPGEAAGDYRGYESELPQTEIPDTAAPCDLIQLGDVR